MRQGSPAAVSPWTWVLALVFLLIISTAITRTPILWGKTAFENGREEAEVFAQTFRVLRALYHAEHDAEMEVVVLGNSRILLATRQTSMEREFARVMPAVNTHVDMFAIFGAGPVIIERLTRHLGRMEPSLVLLTITGKDLHSTPYSQIGNPAYRLLSIGWQDGPIPAKNWAVRMDRWMRTIWPLYRFREFARAALEDRVFSPVDPGPPPARFSTVGALFGWIRGKNEGVKIEAAYRAWRANPTLERFVAYLEVGHPLYLKSVVQRSKTKVDSSVLRRNLAALDVLLERLAREYRKTVVVLMPENPILDLDVDGRYHSPESSDRDAGLIQDAAERHGLTVVDARRWMPAEMFIDFDHLLWDLCEFERPLVREIVNEIAS